MIHQVNYCLSTWSRLKGLLGKAHLASHNYYVFGACKGIHTLAMRFAIDVIFCDADGAILQYVHQLQPNRLRYQRRAFFVIELFSEKPLSLAEQQRIVNLCLKCQCSGHVIYRWL